MRPSLGGSRRRPHPRLPLFWKLLVPFVALIIIVGSFGGFVVVRDLSARAQASLDKDLLEASLRARASLHERELYLLESATFASSLEGMAERTIDGDRAGVVRLLQSVLALKTDLSWLAIHTPDKRASVRFTRDDPGANPAELPPIDVGNVDFVRMVMLDRAGTKVAGFFADGGRTMLAVAAPICSEGSGCTPVAAAVAGIDLRVLVAEAASGLGRDDGRGGLLIADESGRVLASRGGALSSAIPPLRSGTLLRRTEKNRGPEVAWLFAPIQIQSRPRGTIAVSLPTEPAFAGARRTGIRLAVALLAAMAGAVAIGAWLTRSILRQVRPLVETSRSLGAGDMSARAPVLRDDELGELADRLNRMAEELQAANETLELRVAQRTGEIDRLLKERTRLFASISHELRTPLAVILGQVRMLLDPDYRSRRHRLMETAATIADSGEQLLDYVNDILEVARAEEGHLEITARPTSVADVVADVRPTARGLASARELDLSIDVSPNLPAVVADPVRLREVLVNLIDNAVKYTPSGGRVGLSARGSEGAVEIAVSDTGVGIPEEVGDLVYEPFYRVPGVRTQRGEAASGLGLALTRRLVEGQGGTIRYESNPGNGTTFTVRLAVAGPKPASSEAAPTANIRAIANK